jgi:hypothetical protein
MGQELTTFHLAIAACLDKSAGDQFRQILDELE